ncbi:MAG TPA: sulfotransferase [Solirubrobacteraceae bacterium]|nr:sulfotransferase [Solirubrobacteraceae bacterium]
MITARPGGPIVVVGRPRSGSRVVTALLRDAGVFMGRDLHPDTLDPLFMLHHFVAPVVTAPASAGPECAPRDARLATLCRQRLEEGLGRLCGDRPLRGPWGWKICETGLLIPLVKRLLPGARFVHVIRDGRDVCVSLDGRFQLTGPRPPVWPATSLDGGRLEYYDFCRALTFGSGIIRRWHEIDLREPRERDEHRFALQMKSWRHCVERIRQDGRRQGDDYLELRYEALCRDPIGSARELLAWAGRSSDEAVARHARRVSTRSIGAWRSARCSPREARDLERAFDEGSGLLGELGYLT